MKVIKGIQRKMVLIRTPDSRYFEEAHLVLRAERSASEEDGDMLREANRIIASAGFDTESGKRHLRKRGGTAKGGFLLGGLCGGGAIGILWLVVALL